LLLLCLGALSGCADGHDRPIRLGTNQWPGYETFYLARELGLLKNQQVQLVELASTTQTMDALRSNRIDAAGLTLDEVLYLRSEGLDLVVVFITNISQGADALLARPDIPGIQELSELCGRRVGVEYTALGAFILDTALERAGLRRRDIVSVFLPINEHLDAFRQGRVDALVTFDPARQILLKEGARLLFDSSQMPGQVVDVLAVRRELLHTEPEQLRSLLKAQQQALAYLKQQPDKAHKLMASRLGMSQHELKQSFTAMVLPDRAENLRLLTGPTPELGATAGLMAQVMHKRGLLRTLPDLSGLIDTSLIEVKP
jgi:NitT/TauT family transport system substrate-binding protein